ncbi:MAG TPA: SPOR domain-containing protein [Steroidobacteraceae bacterium]|nr:SPOR domain-containing protein [Steroidobacteraceae bacterium]
MDRRVKERLVGATILAVLVVLIVPELLSGPKPRMAPVQPASAAGPAEAVRNVTIDLATSKATPADNTPAENALPDRAAPAAASPPDGSVPAASGISGEAIPKNAAPGDAGPGNVASGDAAAPGDGPSQGTSPAEAPGGTPGFRSRATRGAAPPTIATLRAQQPAHPTEPKLESEPSSPKSQSSKSGNASAAGATAADGASNRHWAVQLGSFVSRENAEKLVRQRKSHDVSLYVSSSGRGASLRYRVRIGPLADRNAAERVLAKLKKEGQSASLVAP